MGWAHCRRPRAEKLKPRELLNAKRVYWSWWRWLVDWVFPLHGGCAVGMGKPWLSGALRVCSLLWGKYSSYKLWWNERSKRYESIALFLTTFCLNLLVCQIGWLGMVLLSALPLPLGNIGKGQVVLAEVLLSDMNHPFGGPENTEVKCLGGSSSKGVTPKDSNKPRKPRVVEFYQNYKFRPLEMVLPWH